jgi:hypothetical protein
MSKQSDQMALYDLQRNTSLNYLYNDKRRCDYLWTGITEEWLRCECVATKILTPLDKAADCFYVCADHFPSNDEQRLWYFPEEAASYYENHLDEVINLFGTEY